MKQGFWSKSARGNNDYMTGVHHDPWQYLHPKNHLSMDLLPSEIWGMNGTETAAGPVKTTAETWRNSHGVVIFLFETANFGVDGELCSFLFWVFLFNFALRFLVFIAYSVLSCFFLLVLFVCFVGIVFLFFFVLIFFCLFVCMFVCLFSFFILFCFGLFCLF